MNEQMKKKKLQIIAEAVNQIARGRYELQKGNFQFG
jgi:hypothetical protein